MPVLLPIHIVAAGLGLVSGAVALSAAKGGRLHRSSGKLFAYAIFAMCGTAVVSAAVKGQATNVMAGSMTAYLVFTGVADGAPAITRIAPPGHRVDAGGADARACDLRRRDRRGRQSRRQAVRLPSFPFFLFGVLGIVGRHSGISRRYGRASFVARRGFRDTCGACAWRCSSPPPHSFRFARAWRRSCPRRSPPRRCARFRSCWCWWRCSIGCGKSAFVEAFRSDGQTAASAGTARCRRHGISPTR